MSLFEQFAMDDKKETEGIEITFAPNKDGSIPTFIVARATSGNIRYTKSIERHTRPYRRLIDSELLDPKTADKIRRQIFIEALLIGWKNIQDAEGKELPFNQQQAETLFAALPELFNELDSLSKKASMYRSVEQDEDAKN